PQPQLGAGGPRAANEPLGSLIKNKKAKGRKRQWKRYKSNRLLKISLLKNSFRLFNILKRNLDSIVPIENCYSKIKTEKLGNLKSDVFWFNLSYQKANIIPYKSNKKENYASFNVKAVKQLFVFSLPIGRVFLPSRPNTGREDPRGYSAIKGREDPRAYSAIKGIEGGNAPPGEEQSRLGTADMPRAPERPLLRSPKPASRVLYDGGLFLREDHQPILKKSAGARWPLGGPLVGRGRPTSP
ncbi:MAG: hypothetical protein ACT6RN_27160, partial [Agrobacterium sp.]|uniref:hypothetical protein n=1 Tax=Agrobacterium sp. TaxID=361 RepID=UPI0040377315